MKKGNGLLEAKQRRWSSEGIVPASRKKRALAALVHKKEEESEH